MLPLLVVAGLFLSVSAWPFKVPLAHPLSPAELEEFKQKASFDYNPYYDIVFHLYTPDNPVASRVIQIDNLESLRESGFRPNSPTRVLVHGWTRDVNDPLIQKARLEYLRKGSYNVIGVRLSSDLFKKKVSYSSEL